MTKDVRDSCSGFLNSPPRKPGAYTGCRHGRCADSPGFQQRITCQRRCRTFRLAHGGSAADRRLRATEEIGFLRCPGKKRRFPVFSFSGLHTHPPHLALGCFTQRKKAAVGHCRLFLLLQERALQRPGHEKAQSGRRSEKQCRAAAAHLPRICRASAAYLPRIWQARRVLHILWFPIYWIKTMTPDLQPHL